MLTLNCLFVPMLILQMASSSNLKRMKIAIGNPSKGQKRKERIHSHYFLTLWCWHDQRVFGHPAGWWCGVPIFSVGWWGRSAWRADPSTLLGGWRISQGHDSERFPSPRGLLLVNICACQYLPVLPCVWSYGGTRHHFIHYPDRLGDGCMAVYCKWDPPVCQRRWQGRSWPSLSYHPSLQPSRGGHFCTLVGESNAGPWLLIFLKVLLSCSQTQEAPSATGRAWARARAWGSSQLWYAIASFGGQARSPSADGTPDASLIPVGDGQCIHA